MMSEQYNLYLVSSLKEILGNDEAVSKLERFSNDIDDGKKRPPLLIFGPSGIGKTASVHALAKAHNWNIVELNAGDYRDKEAIERKLAAASMSEAAPVIVVIVP